MISHKNHHIKFYLKQHNYELKNCFADSSSAAPNSADCVTALLTAEDLQANESSA